MTQRKRQTRRRRTLIGCWWMRVFALLLFVSAINYVPVHLALETHWSELPTSMHDVQAHPVGFIATGHEDATHHAPHLASDHTLRMASQAQVGPVSFDLCVAATSVEVHDAPLRLPLFLTERQNPPGIPPPDPLQPRAPPLA